MQESEVFPNLLSGGCVQTDICLAFSLMFAEGPPGPPGHSRGGPAHPLPPGCAHHPWCGAGPQVLQPSPPASGWGAAACEWWWECGGRGERWSKGAEGASGPRLPPILHTRAAHSTHPSQSAVQVRHCQSSIEIENDLTCIITKFNLLGECRFCFWTFPWCPATATTWATPRWLPAWPADGGGICTNRRAETHCQIKRAPRQGHGLHSTPAHCHRQQSKKECALLTPHWDTDWPSRSVWTLPSPGCPPRAKCPQTQG